LVYLYSTIKMMHGPINLRFKMIYVTITLYCEYIFANNVTIMFLVFKFKKTDDLFALKNIHL